MAGTAEKNYPAVNLCAGREWIGNGEIFVLMGFEYANRANFNRRRFNAI
jgi:hypothetical protein